MSDDPILTERLRGRTLRDLAEAKDMAPSGNRARMCSSSPSVVWNPKRT
jgi:hypothetical protein